MEIESNIEIAEEAIKKPRARKATAKKTNPAASLIEALKFIAVAQKKTGTVQQQFCYMGNYWLGASNEVLLIATPIEEDLNACPHTLQLLDALGKCKDELSIVQLSPETLAVNSEKFKGLIPCVELSSLNLGNPDPVAAQIDNRVKDALAATMILATEGAPNAYLAVVMLQANTAVATNGFAMIEYWHGFDLPPNMMIPKASAQAIVKCSKNLTGFGYGGSSATFHFEDGSFIKTQLFADRFVAYESMLRCEAEFKPLPREFFIAVHAIESFSENGIVYFDKGLISSREETVKGTTYKIKGLPENLAFKASYLLQLEKNIKEVYFHEDPPKLYFRGESQRGCLMACDHSKGKPNSEEPF